MDIRKYFNVLNCKNETNSHTENETDTDTENDYDLVEEEPKKQTETFKFKKTIQVFTDGSSFNNGSKTKKHSGGIGVFFGKNHPYNKSIKIKDEPITNNIAELKACILAITTIIENKNCFNKDNCPIDIEIYTDSEYVINSITKWAKLWKFNGWKKKEGNKLTEIKNKDLIIELYELYDKIKPKFKHVRAHRTEPKNKFSKEYSEWYGNYMADKLATQASNSV